MCRVGEASVHWAIISARRRRYGVLAAHREAAGLQRLSRTELFARHSAFCFLPDSARRPDLVRFGLIFHGSRAVHLRGLPDALAVRFGSSRFSIGRARNRQSRSRNAEDNAGSQCAFFMFSPFTVFVGFLSRSRKYACAKRIKS